MVDASIESVSSSARVTSAKFQKGLEESDIETPGPIDRTPGTPGSAKKDRFESIDEMPTSEIEKRNMESILNFEKRNEKCRDLFSGSRREREFCTKIIAKSATATKRSCIQFQKTDCVSENTLTKLLLWTEVRILLSNTELSF